MKKLLPKKTKTPKGLRLDDQLCFVVYAASRAITRAYRPLLDPFGITYPQYLVMLVLAEKHALKVKELGVALQLDSGTLSPLLKRLEAMKLVTRKRSQSDEREVELQLSAKGLELYQRMTNIPDKMGCTMGLSMEAQRRLRQELRSITDRMQNGSGKDIN